MDSRLKNLTPKQAKQFLEKHNFIRSNVEGTHWTYYKTVGDETWIVQVIDNNKQCYPSNTRQMIRRSGIPEKEWANFKNYLKKH